MNKTSGFPIDQPLKFVTTNLYNMKFAIIAALLFSITARGQVSITSPVKEQPAYHPAFSKTITGEVKIEKSKRWHMDRNKWITGSLLFTAGAAKGFNEAIQYKYNGFQNIFPKANDQWFYPTFSFKNKYKDGDPEKGAKFPLSTSVLVMFTDQYHLNNFIQQSALTASLVIKIGEGKKPFRQYVFDLIYYTACYQLGFHSIYYPISARN